MDKQEKLLLTKSHIVQITKDLKSHFIEGDFIDPDKNFIELLMKIIVLINLMNLHHFYNFRIFLRRKRL